ncbi:MAG TPA: hypothetical protein VID75_01430 [Acidimicrobiales bacterium]|jgi:hypothetical protein
MTNPSAMQQLAKEHQRDILGASRVPRAGSLAPKVRQRLGWSLIGLGVHLALEGARQQNQNLGVAGH